MSATLAPFGLKPAYHPSGTLRLDEATIASGYGANIYSGSPVKFVTGGGIELAAAGDRIAGIFAGCQFTRSDGTIYNGPYWPTGSTYVAGSCKAYIQGVIGDTEAIYEVQADATLTVAAIGRAYNTTVNATGNGSTSTGISDVKLGVSTAATTQVQLMVVGLAKTPDNDWGDTYPVVLVKITNPQFGAPFVALY